MWHFKWPPLVYIRPSFIHLIPKSYLRAKLIQSDILSLYKNLSVFIIATKNKKIINILS